MEFHLHKSHQSIKTPKDQFLSRTTSMRVVSSCTTCRARKKRCIASTSDAACKFCLLKGLRCDAPHLRKLSDTASCDPGPAPATTSPSDTSQPSESFSLSPENAQLASQGESTSDSVQATLNDRSLCEELINIYFTVIHSNQHLLFHHTSFLDNQREGLIPSYILLGIIALSARFSSHPSFKGINPWLRGKPFFEEGIRCFDRRKELVSIEAIQGCVLLGFYAFTDGDTARDDLLSCQAVRMSQTLKLPTTLHLNGLMREIEINVYWQTWMVDRWTSVRSGWPLQLGNDHNLPRPLRQEVFDLLTPDSPPCDLSNSNGLRESSMWGLILPLTQWHAEVVRLNFQIATEISRYVPK
ncbi:fungal specific transcription factor [Fusarium denticulatum]|uniref:Fungal specific transcription factor n=1 Tax=Fusarium denticulatum TaxID=48507 RepID=A0A8H5U9T4_9HYPO|nr:fungal specific transcription factor [Fusarium denticulatum]